MRAMRRPTIGMRRTLVGVAIAVILLLASPFVVGNMLPRDHSVFVEDSYAVPAQALFYTAVNIDGWPAWRSEVDSVEHLEGAGFQAAIILNGKKVVYEFDANFDKMTMTSKMVSDDLPYGGEWRIGVAPLSEYESTITVTENGYVDAP